MLTRLIAETHMHHAGADAPWLALMVSSVRRQDYQHHLARTYGFEAPFESALAYTDGVASIIQLRERARAGFLVQDMLALGWTPSRITDLPQCGSITPFRDPAEALGWLYVIERATLLHESIRRHLLRRLPDARHATAYLASSGSASEARWQRFGVALDEYVVGKPDVAEPIVNAASQAFERWHVWLATTYATD